MKSRFFCATIVLTAIFLMSVTASAKGGNTARVILTKSNLSKANTPGKSASGAQPTQGSGQLTPVVLFPAFHFTKLQVKVQNQTTVPGCPQSGTFTDWFPNPNPSPHFSQECQDRLLTLVYNPHPSNMSERFSNQPGVTVTVRDYGRTQSAPFYEDMYDALEAVGYERNKNIRVAGYDSRLTPDIGDFLEQTIDLIEETYYSNNNTPVHLVGHSNGPLYAQYLLTHTSQEWKDQFIHGFTPIAGNWPGQGILYSVLFTGLNVRTFQFPTDAANAASSAAMYRSHPSSYMSAADPKIFGDQEVVVQLGNGHTYTPNDYDQLFLDASFTNEQREIANHYIGFIKFRDPSDYPNVDVYAEKGSGLSTTVGLKLKNLSLGQVINVNNPNIFINRDGDANQEDITNDAIKVWTDMECFRFKLRNNAGVNHFDLVSNTNVLNRLVFNLNRVKSTCP